MPDRERLVEGRGLVFRPGGQTVLDGIDITVDRGEIVSLIGPNGAGKTSLVRLVLGLARPDAGSVWRRDGLVVGYVPQRLVIDPVLPLSAQRFLALGGQAPAALRAEVLAEVGVAHLLARPVQRISGGEFQRLLLARALLRRPDLLVLDEPVQGVDVTGQAEIYEMIARIRERRGCAVLLVSHDLHLVMAATDRVVCINRHLCCAGHPETVSRHPEYVALFGPGLADKLAHYAHRHDHVHGAGGEVLPIGEGAAPAGMEARHDHG
ncbi:MAG: ATP-binding cassette domain-containing protein [Alphaproteobacteria bacterium]|nr:ATP-binding cassette domain-containing protein [Alphaproteobacteria bacterium]